VVLQRILGHSDIRVTMRYAPFASDHLEESVTNSPLAEIAQKVTQSAYTGSYRG